MNDLRPHTQLLKNWGEDTGLLSSGLVFFPDLNEPIQRTPAVQSLSVAVIQGDWIIRMTKADD